MNKTESCMFFLMGYMFEEWRTIEEIREASRWSERITDQALNQVAYFDGKKWHLQENYKRWVS